MTRGASMEVEQQNGEIMRVYSGAGCEEGLATPGCSGGKDMVTAAGTSQVQSKAADEAHHIRE